MRPTANVPCKAPWLLSALVLGLFGCVDDLVPSTLTTGWNHRAAASATALPLPPPAETLEPAAPSLAVPWQEKAYVDWRTRQASSAPCPPEMALIARSFCIDRWEATVVEITPEGERAFEPTHRVEGHLVRAVSRAGVMPQGYISGAEAQRACEMAGKRLCDGDEWQKACEGSKHTVFPYGPAHQEGLCNEARSLHPMLELYGPNPDPSIWYVEPMNNPAINEQPDTVSRTGSRPGCKSSGALFDMVGNLHEWTNDPAGTFLGGAYSTKNALGCRYKTTAHGFSYHDYSTGFRCCSDPLGEP